MDALSLVKQQVATARREFNGVMQDVSQDMGNWQPPGVANSIVDLYLHTTLGADRAVSRITGKPALIDQWAAKMKIPAEFRHTPEASRALRADVATLKQYGEAVAGAVDGMLASFKDADLDRMLDSPRGPAPITNTLTYNLITHVAEHTGEISAIKGLQGAKGYATA